MQQPITTSDVNVSSNQQNSPRLPALIFFFKVLVICQGVPKM